MQRSTPIWIRYARSLAFGALLLTGCTTTKPDPSNTASAKSTASASATASAAATATSTNDAALATPAQPAATVPPAAQPTPQPGLVSVHRQYDIYVGNILAANSTQLLVWCFDRSQAMPLTDSDVIRPYTGKCPSGVMSYAPEDERVVRPIFTPTPRGLPAILPLPLATLRATQHWRVRVYRPKAVPTLPPAKHPEPHL